MANPRARQRPQRAHPGRARRRRRAASRSVDIDLLAPNDHQPRRADGRRAARGARAIDQGHTASSSRSSCARVDGGAYRDHRRRAPLARRAAAGLTPRARRRARRRRRHGVARRARDGADREHPARGPEPDRRGHRLSPPRRRVPPDAGRDRRGGRQGPLDGRQHAPPAASCRTKCSTRSPPGALSMGHARALLALPTRRRSARSRATSSRAACRCARPKRS